MILQKTLCLLVGYLFGLIATGYFYAKLVHVDIRHMGSGNTGSTNTLRVLGKKAGLIVFIGDFLKCFVPAMVVRYVLAGSFVNGQTDAMIYAFYIGLGTIIGHNFPFYLHFKGGKGIACTGALVIVLDPLVALVGFTVFVLVVFFSGYVSLGSLCGVSISFILIVLKQLVFGYGLSDIGTVELYVLGLVMTGLAFFQHRANIVRLAKGTENKFNTKKRK